MNISISARPNRFDEVYGHDSIMTELMERQKNNNFPKVMYLTGGSGTGKTTTMRIIAKSILCGSKKEDGNPCNECKTCQTIDSGVPNNYFFEENASNLNVEKMREIDSSSKKRPLGEIKNKVFIIDELQELNKNQTAQKNLLKTLEAPSSASYFILGSMDDSKVNNAIKRRAVTYKMNPVPTNEVANYLQGICVSENIEVTEKVIKILFLIADSSNGSPGIATPLLERVIYSNLWDMSIEDLTTELDIVDDSQVKNLLKGMIGQDISVFEKTYTDNILDILRNQLNIIYKYKSGLELQQWQKGLVDGTGFSKVSISIIKKVIEEINKLYLFPFITPVLLEFTLLNCYNIFGRQVESAGGVKVKLQEETPKQETVVRRSVSRSV